MNSTVFALFEKPFPDPGMMAFPLLTSPWIGAAITAVYLLFVLKIGRTFMKNRKPYDLKNVILTYNGIQVIYNGALFLTGIYYLFIKQSYDLRCMKSLPFDHPDKETERWLTYAYYINKLLDLCDTIFFVLRKSYKQITFLHIYHHINMYFGFYYLLRFYGAGGQYTMIAFFNTFVHTVMYTYYFISAMYPGLKGSLWWKKYITRLQITQFVILFMQALMTLVFNPSCTFPVFMQFLQIFQASMMIVMFSNFYYHAYIKPKNQKQQ